jgi:hypothetical protein
MVPMSGRKLVHVKNGSFDAILPPEAHLSHDYETTRGMLEEIDRNQRPFRTKWRCEILGTSIKLSTVKLERTATTHTVSLDEEIVRCWFEAGWAYTYGLFQSATLLACAIIELVIERYLRSKDLWIDYENEVEEKHRTLGSVISFCRPRKNRGTYFTEKILEKSTRLNEIRIEAAHMNKRRNVVLKLPPKFDSLDDIDEIENVMQPAMDGSGKKDAYFSVGETGILYDPTKQDFYKVRAFKRYAREAIALTSEISKLVFELT